MQRYKRSKQTIHFSFKWSCGPITTTLLMSTSQTRLRVHDQCTLIGGKGRAGPSSLHTTLEGPTKYVKARWMWSLHGIEWITFHSHLDYFQKPPLGGRPNTKLEDHGTLEAHNRCFILFYHVWGHAWIEIYGNSIWLMTWSHMTSHCTWGSVTTLHDFGGVLGQPLNNFFWALKIPWSQLLAHVWSGPQPLPEVPFLKGERKRGWHRRGPSRSWLKVIHELFFRPLGLHLLVWSELGQSPPCWRMRALTLSWSWAFNLVCEVALSMKL
jgi:hypothetical protein